jgi:peptide/nickel transport system substrate-binding protein
MNRREIMKLLGAGGAIALSGGTAWAQSGSADRLSVALAVNLPSLDPHFTTAVVTRQIGCHMFETLLTYDAEYNLTPMLAETWSTSEDGLATTITLREGMLFHDGSPVTSADVVASLTRWRQVSTVGKSTFVDVTDISAEDERTVVITASAASSALLEALASPTQAAAILPAAVAEAAGKDEITTFVGTGPYRLKEWQKDQYVTLERFAEYVPLDSEPSGLGGRKEALIPEIRFDFVTNAPSRIAGLQSGEYDFVDDVPPDNYDTLEGDSRVQTYIGKPSRQNIMFFNCGQGVFSNPAIRKAANKALDLDSIMLASAARPDFYRIDPGLMFREQTLWYSDAGADLMNLKDPEGAKADLAAAGYSGERVVILTSREYQYLYRASLVIQQQLAMIGVNVELEVYDWPTLLERRRDASAWDIFFTFAGIYIHPSQITFVDSRKGYPGGYANPEVDALLDQLVATADREAAAALFHDAQALYRADVPTVKLGDMFALSASGPQVTGFDYFFDLHFWNVSLSR